ncbi:gliding motility-associated C-terminal domain-containing protein [Fulvivirga kasyanovii]|uniref:T9SS type B sorting domain-containing protein n=1 Tax=Fulvivirga kasyanovii TaxID=396812 RepID=A0ABW9S0A5_9BACT|nr:gliding motility-associated C-terminal domain-containing protein [Fulvivirga kasyanovii]MTI29043.1 T9SS type B sorting domain-containing protein [Fulvivirga kasyanovii]
MKNLILLALKRLLTGLLFGMALFTTESFGQRVYWTQGTDIKSANLDGSLQQTHFTHPDQPHKISIDHSNNIAFFLTVPGQGDLYRISLSSFTTPTLIYSWPAMTAGYNMDHHPGDALIFTNAFVDSDPGSIEYSNYTDQDCCQSPSTLNIGSYSGDIFHDINVDTDGEYVYVSNEFDGVIYRTGTFGGSLTTIIPSGAGESFDFDFGAREIIYENPSTDRIMAADMDSGSGTYTKISSGLTDIKAIAVHPDGRLIILDGTTLKTANSDGSNLFSIITGLTGATDISLSGCSDPTIQASSPVAVSNSSTSIDLSWTNGNGNEVLVVAKQGSAVNSGPKDGILHPASATFGSGDPLGLGNFVVYRGTGNSVTVTNLAPSTTYHFAIYSLNNFGACYRTPGVTASTTTLAAPSVQNVSSALTNGSYPIGTTITVEVTFDQNVTVTGTPRILLETGTTDRYATYGSGSGSNTLTFQYMVQAGDISDDLEYTSATALELNGGTINATADNATATLTLPAPGSTGSLATNKNIAVDGLLPLVTSINPSVAIVTDTETGTSGFTLTVRFGEAMNTTVNPQINFPTEDPSSTLTFNSGNWVDNTTYAATYDVLDVNQDLANIDVTVSLGEDQAGNVMAPASQANIFSIDMCSPPAISVQPVSKTTCSNVPVNFAVTATGTTVTYQWQKDDGAGGPFNNISNGSQFSGTTTNQLSVDNPTGLDGHRFQCVVTESGNCSVTSSVVTLTVDPLPSTSNAGSPGSVCGTSYTLNANAPAIGTGTWSVVSMPSGSAGISFSDINSHASSATINSPEVYGTYELQWEISSGICSSNTSTVLVTFGEAATSDAGTNFSACANSNFDVTGTVGGAATSGHWRVASGAGSFTSSNGTTGSSSAGPSITDTYQPGSGDAGSTVTLELVAEDPDGAGACTLVTSTVDISIVAPPAVASASASICSNASTGIILNATPGPVSSYSIKAIRVPSGLTANAGNATVAPGYNNTAISGDSYNNTAATPLTVEYDIAAIGSGLNCEGPVTTITVTVNPLPQIFTVSGGGSTCSGGTIGMGLSGSQSGFNYILRRNASTTVQTLPGTGTVLSFTPQSVAGTYTVEAVHPVTNCSQTMNGSAVVSVNTPPSSAALSGGSTICAGSSAQLTLNISGGTSPYIVDIQNIGVISFSGNPISVTPANTTTYVINSVVDANNCSAQSIDNTPVTIQVDQAPTQAQAGANAETCDSQFANLGGNTPAVGTGQWTLVSGSGTITSPGNPQSGVTGLQFGENVFQWTISNGSCPASSATITITRTDVPTGVGIVESSSGRNSFCQNDQGVTFTVSRIVGASSYIWSLPEGFEPVSGSAETTEPSIVVNLADAQSGAVEVIGKNICGSSPVSNALNVTILPVPEANIITETSIVSNRTTQFSMESTSDIASLLWNFGDGATSTERSPSHIYTTSGSLTVALEITNSNGCKGIIEKNITVTGLEPIGVHNIKNAITPNGDGANDVLYIENIENFPNNVVTLLDRWGVEVIKLESYKNDWDLVIQGSTIPAGNYLCIVQVQDGDNAESKVVTRTVTVVKGKTE